MIGYIRDAYWNVRVILLALWECGRFRCRAAAGSLIRRISSTASF